MRKEKPPGRLCRVKSMIRQLGILETLKFKSFQKNDFAKITLVTTYGVFKA
jgi:hypothetical protein